MTEENLDALRRDVLLALRQKGAVRWWGLGAAFEALARHAEGEGAAAEKDGDGTTEPPELVVARNRALWLEQQVKTKAEAIEAWQQRVNAVEEERNGLAEELQATLQRLENSRACQRAETEHRVKVEDELRVANRANDSLSQKLDEVTGQLGRCQANRHGDRLHIEGLVHKQAELADRLAKAEEREARYLRERTEAVNRARMAEASLQKLLGKDEGDL